MNVPAESSLDVIGRVDEFMRLYAQHQRRIYLYLLSLVHNATDAEELLQETSCVLWKKFDQYEPETHFAAWACRIAYLEVLRFRDRQKRNGVPLSPEYLQRVAEKMVEMSDEFERRTKAFYRCIEKLRESDRELILRRYAPGASVAQVAAELCRPVRSVSKSLVRIRKSLVNCINHRLRREES